MTYAKSIIVIRMASDQRIPAGSLGYVADLGSPNASPAVIADRLRMLARYVPDLAEEYRTAA